MSPVTFLHAISARLITYCLILTFSSATLASAPTTQTEITLTTKSIGKSITKNSNLSLSLDIFDAEIFDNIKREPIFTSIQSPKYGFIENVSFDHSIHEKEKSVSLDKNKTYIIRSRYFFRGIECILDTRLESSEIKAGKNLVVFDFHFLGPQSGAACTSDITSDMEQKLKNIARMNNTQVEGLNRTELTFLYADPILAQYAAVQLSKYHEFNERKIEAAAQRVFDSYKNPDPENIRMVTLLIRIIAQNGSKKYTPFFQNLQKDTINFGHPGLTKHIDRALKLLVSPSESHFVATSIEPVNGYTKEELKKIAFEENLKSSKHIEREGAAIYITKSKISLSIDQFDEIAQNIWDLRHSENRYAISYSIWLARALATSQNTRYAKLFENIMAEESMHKKLNKNLKRLLPQLVLPSDESFQVLPESGTSINESS